MGIRQHIKLETVLPLTQEAFDRVLVHDNIKQLSEFVNEISETPLLPTYKTILEEAEKDGRKWDHIGFKFACQSLDSTLEQKLLLLGITNDSVDAIMNMDEDSIATIKRLANKEYTYPSEVYEIVTLHVPDYDMGYPGASVKNGNQELYKDGMLSFGGIHQYQRGRYGDLLDSYINMILKCETVLINCPIYPTIGMRVIKDYKDILTKGDVAYYTDLSRFRYSMNINGDEDDSAIYHKNLCDTGYVVPTQDNDLFLVLQKLGIIRNDIELIDFESVCNNAVVYSVG